MMTRPFRSLPLAVTPLIGRVQELQSIVSLIDGHERLITLTGIGGIGKTRLATEAARAVAARDATPVAFVELAPISDDSLVVGAILDGLGIRERPTRRSIEAAAGALSGRDALLVMDNCEHVLSPVAGALAQLFSLCPALTVLATSRVPLHLAGEIVWVVPPLSLSTHDGGSPSAAAELYLERASRRGACVDADANVERVVTSLNGIPLAVELAAARARILSTRDVADALHDHLSLLRGGPVDAAARHRTMRASLDWSVELLDQESRHLLAQFSVFAGSFTRAAAESLAGRDVLDVIDTLVDASLLIPVTDGRRTRYRLLEFVRQYADSLLDDGERAAVAAAHRRYYASVAARAEAERWASTRDGLGELDVEAANLRVALRNATRTDGALAVRMAGQITPYWIARGRLTEAVDSIEAALAATGPEPTGERAAALCELSMASLIRGDVARCAEATDAAIACAEAVGDPAIRAVAHARMASFQTMLQPREGEPHARHAIALAGEAGEPVLEVDARMGLLLILGFADERASFWAELPVAIEQARATGHTTASGWIQFAASAIAARAGDLDVARAFARSRDGENADDDQMLRLFTTTAWCLMLLYGGDIDQSRQAAERELARERLDPSPVGTTQLEWVLGLCALAEGDEQGALAWASLLLTPDNPAPLLRIHGHLIAMYVGLCRRDTGTARRHAQAAIDGARAYGTRRIVAVGQCGLAHAHLLVGELEPAERLAQDALVLFSGEGWQRDAPTALELIGWAAAERGQSERAARLLGAAAGLRSARGLIRIPGDETHWRGVLDRAGAVAGGDAVRDAWHEGSELDLEQAVLYARRGRGVRKRDARGWESLTPIERQIAELAAAGHSNPEIASRLFVSRGTTKTHLSSVYRKLGISSRVELAAHLSRSAAETARADGFASRAPQ